MVRGKENQVREDLAVTKKIRKVVFFTLTFSVFGGALRKWIISANVIGNIVVLIQLVLPFFFTFFLLNERIASPFGKFKVLSFYLFLLILLLLNPMNQTILHGILGFLLHIGFWFLMFFYCANKKYFQLDTLIPACLVFCIIQLILGVIQYNLPTTHFLNQYADNDRVTSIATIGDRVRITGTFSYLGGLSSFLVFQIFLLWTALRKHVYPRLSLVILLSGFILAIMSGSRSTVLLYIIFFGLMLSSEYLRSKLIRQVSLQVPILVGLILIGFVYVGSGIDPVQKASLAWDNFNGRVKQNRASGEEQQRVIDPILKTIYFRGDYPLVGVGLGATYQGATALFGTSKYVTEYGYVEEEWERVVLEGGFTLFLFRIFLFIALFQNLSIPAFPRAIILLVTFIFIPIIIHTYNAFFLALGLIFLDQSYDQPKNNSIKH